MQKMGKVCKIIHSNFALLNCINILSMSNNDVLCFGVINVSS